jgi:hypothetical protein
MPERLTSANLTSGGESDDRSALADEVARQKEEILRLRDLLIAKDAELGTAKGKLAELTEHSARLVIVARRLQALASGLPRRVAAVLRRRG